MTLRFATKRCPECGETKPSTDFHRSRSSPDGMYTYCKPCSNTKTAAYTLANPERVRKIARKKNLAKNYDITPEDYDAMHDVQAGLCLVCGQPETKRHKSGKLCLLAVDHDHATGKVRGLLCQNCNIGIGHLGDDPGRCRAAADYLEETA